MAVYKTIRNSYGGHKNKKQQPLFQRMQNALDEDERYSENTQSLVKQYQASSGQKADSAAVTKTQSTSKGSGTTSAQQLVKQYEEARPKYAPSDALKEAEALLAEHTAKKPAAYESAYTQQLETLYDKILNRGDFSYDPTEDPLYARYKDKYVAGGQLAMQDAMANAAALTGGYGNTYAQMAGQQQMNAYMTELADILPEMENRAYLRWRNAEDELYDQIYLTERLDEADYEKYRDTVGDYYEDLDHLYGQYRDTYKDEYESYLDALELWQEERDHYYEMAGETASSGGGSSRGSSGGASGDLSAGFEGAEAVDAQMKGAQARDAVEKILFSVGDVGNGLRGKYTQMADAILKKLSDRGWDAQEDAELWEDGYYLPEEEWANDLSEDEEEKRIKNRAKRK